MERTLVLIKPDGTVRGLIGEIIRRLEQKGLRIVAAKFMMVPQSLAEKHYQIHQGKPFYPGLIRYITSAPIMAMVWEGPNAVAAMRQTMGATRPAEALPGTIRHDLSLEVGRNLTHSSDSIETADHEINIWFRPEELVDWVNCIDPWIYGKN